MTRQPQPADNYDWTWLSRPAQSLMHTCSDCGRSMLNDDDYCTACEDSHAEEATNDAA